MAYNTLLLWNCHQCKYHTDSWLLTLSDQTGSNSFNVIYLSIYIYIYIHTCVYASVCVRACGYIYIYILLLLCFSYIIIIWKMKVTLILIIIGALGTVPKGLVKGLEEWEIGWRSETIQTTALLRSVRILRWVLGRLAVIQTPGKDYQQTLVWKTQ